MRPAQRRTVAVSIALFLAVTLVICWLSYIAETYYDHVEIIDSSRYSSVQVLLDHYEFGETLEPMGKAPPLNLGWLAPDDVVTVLLNSQNEAGDDRIEASIDGAPRVITEEGFMTGDVVRPSDALVVLCSFTASGGSTSVTGACDPRCPWHCPALPSSFRTGSIATLSWQSRAYQLATEAKPIVLVILALLGAVVLILHDVQQVRADRARGRTKKRTWFAGLVTVVSLVSGALTIAGVIGYVRGLLLIAVLGVIALVAWMTELLLEDLIALGVKAQSAPLALSSGPRQAHTHRSATTADSTPTESTRPTERDASPPPSPVSHRNAVDDNKDIQPPTRTSGDIHKSDGPLRPDCKEPTQHTRVAKQRETEEGQPSEVE